MAAAALAVVLAVRDEFCDATVEVQGRKTSSAYSGGTGEVSSGRTVPLICGPYKSTSSEFGGGGRREGGHQGAGGVGEGRTRPILALMVLS